MPASHAATQVTPDGADLRILAMLPLSAGLAWPLPPRRREAAARLTVGPLGRLAEKIGRILGGEWAGRSAGEIARGHQLMLRRGPRAHLRCHAPRVRRPRPSLHGNGLPVYHPSQPDHGFSRRTRIWRLRNPLRARVEERFLRERVLLGEGNRSQAALRRLSSLLRQGEIVSITVGPHGSRVISAPFAGGCIEVASSAPALAARTGAALLPVWAWRCADGSCATRIAAPLAPANGHQAPDQALAEQLERFARFHPEQVQWGHSCLRPPAARVAARPG